MTDEIATLLQQIANEGSLAADPSGTRPLFDAAAARVVEGIQRVREGAVAIAVTIVPAVAYDFAEQFTELEKRYTTAPLP